MTDDTTYTIQEAAKIYGIGVRRLFRLLRERRAIDINNWPIQRRIDQGYLVSDVHEWQHPVTGTQFRPRARLTTAGMRWLGKIIRQGEAA